MNVEHLVRMANQIGAFFEAEPDPDEVRAGIAQHLKRFWDPRLRRTLVAYAEEGGAGLKEIVRQAIRAHRENLV